MLLSGGRCRIWWKEFIVGQVVRFSGLILASLMAVFVLVACSSEERGAVDEGTQAPEKTTEATRPSTAARPAGANAGLVVGDTAVTQAGNEITVHSYERVPPDDTFQPEPGFEFAAADVEGCAAEDIEGSAGLNPLDFALQMPDNTRLQADIGVKEPPLNDTTLPPGDCVRGFVTFQVPEGQKPTNVIYTASSIIKWAVEGVGGPSQASQAVGTTAPGGTAPEGQSPEDVLTSQYEFINAGDYESAYALFDESSKSLVSPEQYAAFFEENAPYSLTDYSFPSSSVQGDTATVEAEFTVNSATGGERYQRTQQLVREGGAWRVVMRDDQVSAFTEAVEPAPTPQYDDGAELSPNDQAMLDLANCQSEEATQDLGPEGANALFEQLTDRLLEEDTNIQTLLAEEGYTCGGQADELLGR